MRSFSEYCYYRAENCHYKLKTATIQLEILLFVSHNSYFLLIEAFSWSSTPSLGCWRSICRKRPGTGPGDAAYFKMISYSFSCCSPKGDLYKGERDTRDVVQWAIRHIYNILSYLYQPTLFYYENIILMFLHCAIIYINVSIEGITTCCKTNALFKS